MNRKQDAHKLYLAIGSSMDVMPMGSYSEYMPKGTPAQRISESWQRVGQSLTKNVKKYDEKNTDYSYR